MKFKLTIEAGNIGELRDVLNRLSPDTEVKVAVDGSDDEGRVTSLVSGTTLRRDSRRVHVLKTVNLIGGAAAKKEIYRAFRKAGFRGEYRQVGAALNVLKRMGLVDSPRRGVFAPTSKN